MTAAKFARAIVFGVLMGLLLAIFLLLFDANRPNGPEATMQDAIIGP